jgi:ABC-type antimicrobial peptide transport system permease subunit
MAVGATPSRVVRLISKDTVSAMFFGALAGLGAAIWLQKALSTLLFGIAGIDVPAYALAASALTAAAVLASVVPSLRAAATDPATTLRAQ